MVAGYVDGTFQWQESDWNRFTCDVMVRIATRADTDDGHVADCEPGAMSVSGAVGWVDRRRQDGSDPSVYVSADRWPRVRAAFARAGVAEPHWWVARWNGKRGIPDGAVAHQFTGSAGSGGHFDLSAVRDHWPGVDPPKHHATNGETPEWEAGIVNRLPTLGEGARDHAGHVLYVHRVQGLCTALGHDLGNTGPSRDGVDGVFGPLTVAAVRRVQDGHNIAVDGVVGPHTWSVLVTGADI